RRVVDVLGMSIGRPAIARHLRALGATVRTDAQALRVTAPSFRGDLRLEEDLIEEVARLGGYERVPVALPEVLLADGRDTPERTLARRTRELLVADGLVEMVTLAFTDAETNRRLPGFVGRELSPIAVRNPLSSETGELRRSPLAGLVLALLTNVDRGASFVGAFELGKGDGLDRQRVASARRGLPVLPAAPGPPFWWA